MRNEQIAERPSELLSSTSRFRICAWIETSSAETGSSQMTSDGSQDQCPGNADALALAAGEFMRIAIEHARRQAHMLEGFGSRRWRSAAILDTPCTISGASRMARMVLRGLSEPNGILEDHLQLAPHRLQLRRRSAVMSVPGRRCCPAGVSTSRMMALESVDLPLPDSPTMPSVSPLARVQRHVVERRVGRADESRRSREIADRQQRLGGD